MLTAEIVVSPTRVVCSSQRGRAQRPCRPGRGSAAGASQAEERGHGDDLERDLVDVNGRAEALDAAWARQQVLQNRDILRLFTGLDLFDSLLLKSGVREVLFRKPDPQ